MKEGSSRGQVAGKQGTGSFVGDSCYVLRLLCDNSPLKKSTEPCGCGRNPAKPTSERQRITDRLGVAVNYSSNSKDVCAIFFSYVGTWDDW